MIYGLLSTILESISKVLWKKSLDMTDISKPSFSLLGNVFGVVLFIIFIFLGLFQLEVFFDYKIILLMALTMGLSAFSGFIILDIYKVDKISTIIPYENMDKLFIIIFGFFLFSDTSIFSLLIALLTIVVIAFFSIDFKSLKFPKSFPKLLLAKFIKAAIVLLLGYMLTKYNSMTITSLDGIISVIMYIFMLKVIDWVKLSKQNKNFYINRLGGSSLGWFSHFIILFLISDLGVVITTLLGFFGLGSTLLFSYLFLGDKPERKSIILSLIIFVFVSIGYYLK